MVPRTLDEQVQWLDEHSGGHPAVVAELDGRVVGFGSLSTFRSRPAYSTTVEDSVYLLDGYQGRGIGRALLEELLRLASAHGFHSVIARITGENDASIALHAACGFEIVGTEREVGPQVRPVARRGRDADGCSEVPPPRERCPPEAGGGLLELGEWAGLDSNQRSLRSRFTACPLCPLGYRPGAA